MPTATWYSGTEKPPEVGVMSIGLAMHGKWDGISMATPTMHSYKQERPAYSTPQPVENTPANNECRMVDLRGANVASFILGGDEFICLPQAFDLFLKHLVGGLHTVYTKLKRLSISPVVCNVEQVRVLRGLGAIQPGVNRCKLITRKDFEILYQDCTQASRPGRPPKRYPMLPPTADLTAHYPAMRSMAAAAHGILGTTDLNALHKRMRLDQDAENRIHSQERRLSDSPQRDGTAIPSKDLSNDMHANATNLYLQAQQAIRQQYQAASSGIHNGTLDAQQAVAAAGMNPAALAPLMMMSHPALFSGAFPPGMLNHINQIAQNHSNSNAVTGAAAAAAAQIAVNGGNMHQQAAAAYQVAAQASLAAAAASAVSSSPQGDETERSSSTQDGRGSKAERDSPKGSAAPNHIESGNNSNHAESEGCGSPHSSISSPLHGENQSNGISSGQSDSGNSAASPAGINGLIDENLLNGDAKPLYMKGQGEQESGPPNEEEENSDHREGSAIQQPNFLPEDISTAIAGPGSISSMQTLLTNIQGLLKVAADNARLQEKHNSFEIADLKSRMALERQMRGSAEKKLEESEKIRAMIQRRLKKERKVRKILQEQLNSVAQKLSSKEGEQVVEKIPAAPSIPITGVLASGGDAKDTTSPRRQSPPTTASQNGDMLSAQNAETAEATFDRQDTQASSPSLMTSSTSSGECGTLPLASALVNNSNNKAIFIVDDETGMIANKHFNNDRKLSVESDVSPGVVRRELPDHVPGSHVFFNAGHFQTTASQ